MENQSWTLRHTKEREELIESLRALLASSDRKVDKIHGVVTNASIFDEALRALKTELTNNSQSVNS